MKFTAQLLAVSLAANIGLGLALMLSPAHDAASTDSGQTASKNSSADMAANGSGANQADSRANGGVRTTNSASRRAGNVWSELRADGNLEALVERLRAAGFPKSVIRAVVGAEVREQFAERRREIVEGLPDEPYWKAGSRLLDPKVMAAQRALHLEQAQLIKQLLGPDGAEDDEFAKYFRHRQYGDIPADKADQLQRISSDYSDLRAQIQSNANGILMPEDREQIAFIEKEMRADLSEILTPQELLEYELRSSSTAGSLRQQLTTFQPTEEEFRALFNATRAVEERMGPVGGFVTTEQLRQRQAAMTEQAQRVLGAERLKEFQQATDPRYSMINRVVARYGLPATVVPQVGALQQDIQQRSGAIRNNRELPPEQRIAQLSALAQEAEVKLAPLLGDKALAAYKQYGGQWLQALTQPPTPPPVQQGAQAPAAAAKQ